MFSKKWLYVPLQLIQMARNEFPELMDHPTNREDAYQVIRTELWRTRGRGVFAATRRGLAELAVDFGLRERESSDPEARRMSA